MGNGKAKKEKSQEEKIIEKFTDNKKLNIPLMGHMHDLAPKGVMVRLKNCGDWFSMVTDETLTKTKLYKSFNCKNRFCHVCSWRTARKDAFKIGLLMRYIHDIHEKEFIFVHLTAPNVQASELIATLDKFNNAWKKMMLRKEIKPIVKGYIRKLEVTYNSEPVISYDMWHGNPKKHMKPMADYFQRLGLKMGDPNPNYDTYHPHFHIVVAVNKSYFSGRTYLKQEKWLEIWRDVMDDPTITQVHVNRIGDISEGKHVEEVSKYSAKSSDLLVNKEVFGVFYNALRGRQLLTYNGLFKDANKLYKLFQKKSEDKKKDDPFYKFIEVDTTEYMYFLLNRWNFGEYVRTEKRELTDEERREVNRQTVDEVDIE